MPAGVVSHGELSSINAAAPAASRDSYSRITARA
jgi:hypothetical protein